MNMSRRSPATNFFRLAALLTVSANFALAQQPAPPRPLPTGTILKKAPDNAEWLINYKYAGPSLIQVEKQPKNEPIASKPTATNSPTPSAPSKFDRQILVTKTKPVYREQEKGGWQEDRWFTEDLMISIPNGAAPRVVFNSRGDGPLSDFPDFKWIAHTNYVGNRTVRGRECFVFKGEMTPQTDTMLVEGEAPLSVPAMAAIDVESGLPSVLEYTGHVQTYDFRPSPTVKLVLPANVQKLADSWRGALRRANKLPSLP